VLSIAVLLYHDCALASAETDCQNCGCNHTPADGVLRAIRDVHTTSEGSALPIAYILTDMARQNRAPTTGANPLKGHYHSQHWRSEIPLKYPTGSPQLGQSQACIQQRLVTVNTRHTITGSLLTKSHNTTPYPPSCRTSRMHPTAAQHNTTQQNPTQHLVGATQCRASKRCMQRSRSRYR
jgi:hypothetical protein